MAHRHLAFLSLFFPLLVIIPLYAEWLAAALSLGHPPRPSLDDPKGIDGARWMHEFTLIAIATAVPALIVALLLVAAHLIVNRATESRRIAWIALALSSWLALYLLLAWDPGGVLYWWMD